LICLLCWFVCLFVGCWLVCSCWRMIDMIEMMFGIYNLTTLSLSPSLPPSLSPPLFFSDQWITWKMIDDHPFSFLFVCVVCFWSCSSSGIILVVAGFENENKIHEFDWSSVPPLSAVDSLSMALVVPFSTRASGLCLSLYHLEEWWWITYPSNQNIGWKKRFNQSHLISSQFFPILSLSQLSIMYYDIDIWLIDRLIDWLIDWLIIYSSGGGMGDALIYSVDWFWLNMKLNQLLLVGPTRWSRLLSI
jgi:hypothetical protein